MRTLNCAGTRHNGHKRIFAFNTSILNELTKAGLNWKMSGPSKPNENRHTAATVNVVHTSNGGARKCTHGERQTALRCQRKRTNSLYVINNEKVNDYGNERVRTATEFHP
jgi:hypothetical protein